MDIDSLKRVYPPQHPLGLRWKPGTPASNQGRKTTRRNP
jgi:hypothetical protein